MLTPTGYEMHFNTKNAPPPAIPSGYHDLIRTVGTISRWPEWCQLGQGGGGGGSRCHSWAHLATCDVCCPGHHNLNTPGNASKNCKRQQSTVSHKANWLQA
jgi:hypothetical protein